MADVLGWILDPAFGIGMMIASLAYLGIAYAVTRGERASARLAREARAAAQAAREACEAYAARVSAAERLGLETMARALADVLDCRGTLVAEPGRILCVSQDGVVELWPRRGR